MFDALLFGTIYLAVAGCAALIYCLPL